MMFLVDDKCSICKQHMLSDATTEEKGGVCAKCANEVKE